MKIIYKIFYWSPIAKELLGSYGKKKAIKISQRVAEKVSKRINWEIGDKVLTGVRWEDGSIYAVFTNSDKELWVQTFMHLMNGRYAMDADTIGHLIDRVYMEYIEQKLGDKMPAETRLLYKKIINTLINRAETSQPPMRNPDLRLLGTFIHPDSLLGETDTRDIISLYMAGNELYYQVDPEDGEMPF